MLHPSTLIQQRHVLLEAPVLVDPIQLLAHQEAQLIVLKGRFLLSKFLLDRWEKTLDH